MTRKSQENGMERQESSPCVLPPSTLTELRRCWEYMRKASHHAPHPRAATIDIGHSAYRRKVPPPQVALAMQNPEPAPDAPPPKKKRAKHAWLQLCRADLKIRRLSLSPRHYSEQVSAPASRDRVLVRCSLSCGVSVGASAGTGGGQGGVG